MGLLNFFRSKHAQLVFLPDGHVNLYENEIMIGRGKTQTENLEKLGGRLIISNQIYGGATISRDHGTFRWNPAAGRYTYQDHSRSGTLINNKTRHNQTVNLNHKDTLFFPGLKIEILYPGH